MPTQAHTVILCLLCLCLCLCGCRKPQPPRTSADIVQEKITLPALFLSEKTRQEVIAPENTTPIHQGERCWRAYTCTRSECPGVGKGDRPFLFINPDPGADTYCPACLDGRRPADVPTEERRQILWAARPYVLPKTAARLNELDQEHRRALGH